MKKMRQTHFSRLILSSSAAALFAMPSMAQVIYANDIDNVQKNWAEIRAELNADMTAITGDVELTSAAIANSLSVEASGSTDALNNQISGGEVTDVDGNVTVKTTNITSDLDIDPTDSLASLKGTSAAIANSASYEFTGGVDTANVVDSTQYANANTVSDLDANLNGVSGDTELTSAAIANSLSVASDLTTGLDNTQTSFGDTTATLDLVSTASMGKVAATAAAIGSSVSVERNTATTLSTLNRNRISDPADMPTAQSGTKPQKVFKSDIQAASDMKTLKIRTMRSFSTLPSLTENDLSDKKDAGVKLGQAASPLQLMKITGNAKIISDNMDDVLTAIELPD